MTRPSLTSPALLLSAVSLIMQAQAQSGTASSEDIVVTAEKRSSTIRKTPISITALKGSDLARNGITAVAQVAQQVPGVSFKTGGPGQTELEMRGLNSGGGNSPTVGFYLDDTPLTSFAYATSGKVVIDPDLYDIDRIEVLRGPQGTLYGGGSMGGTFKVLTAQPDPTAVKGSIHLTGGGTQGGGLNGGADVMYNLPIKRDEAALRVVLSDRYNSGWIDRVVLDDFPLPTNGGLTRGDVGSAAVSSKKSDVNDDHLESGRAALLWKPNGDLTITPMIFGQYVKSGGQSLVDNPPDNETHYEPFNQAEPIHDNFWLAALTINDDLGWADLTSATSHWRRALSQVQDGTEVIQDVLDLPGYSVADGGIGNDPWTENDTAAQTSEEIRLSSNSDGKWRWIAGLFYSGERSTTLQYSVDADAADTLGDTTLYHEFVPQSFRQIAGFGEATYAITPTVKATAGLRYYDFDSKFSTAEYGFFGPNGDNTPGGSSSTEHDQGFNPKFNLAWTPDSDLTAYANVAKGFRPGGGNQIVPTSGTEEGDACAASLASLGKSANPSTYKPDHLWSYEAGEKSRLFGWLTVNGSVYYEQWSAIQRAVTLSCGYIYTDNAGSANIYGGELELSGRFTSDLLLSANAGYTHATYAQSSLETGVAKGQDLPDVPRISTTQSITYTHMLDTGYTLRGTISNSYVGPRQDVNYAIDELPGYDTASGRIGLESDKGWSIALFIDNLNNSHALLSAINSQVLNIPTMTRDTTLRPRTVGLDFSDSF